MDFIEGVGGFYESDVIAGTRPGPAGPVLQFSVKMSVCVEGARHVNDTIV